MTGRSVTGIASLGPAADKSGDLDRQVRHSSEVVRRMGHISHTSPAKPCCRNLSRMSDRTLVLLRHAKSAYPGGVADHERPLAPRGEREAALAGDWLRAHLPAIDAVLCSTATRTRETLARTGIDAPVRYVEQLYDATAGTVIDEINGVGDDVSVLLVIGHEPTMTEVALGLANPDTTNADAADRISTKFPTSAMAVLRLNGSWTDLELGSAQLADFHVPR
jgi:phosphohistidine phosphatase